MKSKIEKYLTPEIALQFSQLSRQGTVILIGVFLVKSHVDLENIGIYEILMYLVSVTSFFWVNGLIQGFLSLYPKLPGEEQEDFINEVYSMFFTCSLVVFGVFVMFQKSLIPLLANRNNLPFFNITFVYYLLYISTLLLDYLLFLKQQKSSQIINGILHLLALPAVLIPLLITGNLYYSIAGLTGLALVRHGWLIVITGLPFQKIRQTIHIKKWLALSFPLVLYALVAGFAQYFDLWLIGIFYQGDPQSFVIFRYGAREIPLTLIIATTFSSAMIPVLANNLSSMDIFKKKSEKLMHLLYPITFVLLLFSGHLYQLLYSSDFERSVPVFDIFLFLILGRVLFPQTLLIAMEKTAVLLKISFVEMCLKIILSVSFFQYCGMAGLAWSTVLSALIEKIIYIFILKKSYNIDLQHYTPITWWLTYSSILVLIYFIK